MVVVLLATNVDKTITGFSSGVKICDKFFNIDDKFSSLIYFRIGTVFITM